MYRPIAITSHLIKVIVSSGVASPLGKSRIFLPLTLVPPGKFKDFKEIWIPPTPWTQKPIPPQSRGEDTMKVLEKVVRNHLVDFLQLIQLIQIICMGRSFLSQLLDYQNHQSRRGRFECWFNVLELFKGFDKVDHRVFFSKLSAHGLRGNLVQWIESFLSARH